MLYDIAHNNPFDNFNLRGLYVDLRANDEGKTKVGNAKVLYKHYKNYVIIDSIEMYMRDGDSKFVFMGDVDDGLCIDHFEMDFNSQKCSGTVYNAIHTLMEFYGFLNGDFKKKGYDVVPLKCE